nr:MAG TPA: hypothetical protein [Caudoviricetes sp.]
MAGPSIREEVYRPLERLTRPHRAPGEAPRIADAV